MIPFQLQKASPRLTRPSGSISRRVFGGEADKKLSDICWGGAQPVNSVALRGDLPLPTHTRLMRAILLPAPWIICQYSFRLCRMLPVLLSLDVIQILPYFLRKCSSWKTVQVTINGIIVIIQIPCAVDAPCWTLILRQVLKPSTPWTSPDTFI